MNIHVSRGCKQCGPIALARTNTDSVDGPSQPRISGIRSIGFNPARLRCAKFGVILAAAMFHALLAEAKLGETVPQLTKRFGAPYEVVPLDNKSAEYRFHEHGFDLKVVVENHVSVSETYDSFQPLQPNGDPPNSIVRGILQTNVPGSKWKDATPERRREEAAFMTTDGKYRASIRLHLDNPSTTFTVAVYRSDYVAAPVQQASRADANLTAASPQSQPAQQENTAQTSTDNLPYLDEDAAEWESRAGAAERISGKDASLDSEQREYRSNGYGISVTLWHGKVAVIFITKIGGAAIDPSEIQNVLRENTGTSSWGRQTSTFEHWEWTRQDQKAIVRYIINERRIMVASQDFAHAFHVHNEAAIIAPAAGSLSRGEWRERLKKYCTIPSGHQLLTNQKRLFAVMGKPDSMEHDGRSTYWYYKCTDGVVQLALQLDPDMMGGQIIAEVSDGASFENSGASESASPKASRQIPTEDNNKSGPVTQATPSMNPAQQSGTDNDKERLLIGSWKVGGRDTVVSTYTKGHEYFMTTVGDKTETGTWRIEGDTLIQFPRSGPLTQLDSGHGVMCTILELNQNVLIIGSPDGNRRDAMTALRVR